jgi:hypothetical protein
MNGKYLKSFYPHHGRVFLLSVVLAPLNAIAYLTGVSGKQKTTKPQRPLRLCGELLLNLK